MTVVNTVQNMDWRELARRVRDEVGSVSAVISDPPYSERTHTAYREMEEVGRNAIAYASWSSEEVSAFVETWSPLTRSWMVAFCDHGLAPAWEAAMSAAGRYVFAPLACIEPGSRVRLSGDGPAQWSVWAVVSRPRTREAQKWGALPGGYVVPPEHGWRGTHQGRSGVVGGKPLGLMEAIVRDYTRPGDLVCDPCAGGGTTLLAAKLLGRRYVGSDIDETHVKIARERLAHLPTQAKAGTLPLDWSK